MSDRNPFHSGGNEAMPWETSFDSESFQRNESSEINTDFFSDLINSDGLANTHQNPLPIRTSTTPSSSASPNRDPETSTTTTNLNSTQNTECVPQTGIYDLFQNEVKHPPVLESTNRDVGKEPPREKKQRRSRNSPEPDYSQIILELNKKRKRTGQACDRCRVRRYKCDPGRNGCLNCRAGGLMCKVTDCVTGETYVRGAAGRMAAEVDRLKARIADLERENDELQRKKPCYGLGSANPLIDPTHPSIVLLQQQQHQAKLREQQISKLQIENTQVQKRAAVLKEKNETLQKRIEEQETLLRLTDDFPLYNTKFNHAL
ncbi:hypothetical protein PEBR_01892 [Penicillium brasilianum]|uniref:Zn(2)-C6 fungal-type domain-containing protein n=1 Tax=Penicillium brasilianum TaxID=104259 RepID=A0A1S9S138_PENBI|nr:hypothetical protein PEBR_01892 [Penicillium brasilianum]